MQCGRSLFFEMQPHITDVSADMTTIKQLQQ
jgi:hypothetical protein